MSGAVHPFDSLRRVRRHARILLGYARVGVVRKVQFRTEFVSQVIMDIVWAVTKVGTFEVLFLHADTLAGWSVQDIRVFLGFVFVSDAFMMTWLGAGWHFGSDLKDGKLDPFRVRPASPAVLYFFQTVRPAGLLNMAFGFGYLVFALAANPVVAGARPWLLLPWAIVVGWITITVTTVLFATVELYALNSGLSHLASHIFHSANTYPVDIYSRKLAMVLLYLVPVAIMTHVPAGVVLGRYGVIEALGFTAWILAFGWLAFWFWSRSFRRYESAMS